MLRVMKYFKDFNLDNNVCIWDKKYIKKSIYNIFLNKEFLYLCYNCMNRLKNIFWLIYREIGMFNLYCKYIDLN